jgi:hypothetical protein
MLLSRLLSVPLVLSVLPVASSAADLREMSTDRPDTTESPQTVDAGHFQIETSFFDYARDAGEKTWTFGQLNIKAGVARNSDVQLVLDTWIEEEGGESRSGFGDVTLRWKQNLWGNDGGLTSFALMPFVTIPTGTRVSAGEWQGGLIAPLGFTVSDRVYIGLMAEVDVVYDEDSEDYELEWLHSATLGLGLTERLGVYLEMVGIVGADTSYQALFDSGVTFAVTDNLILDAGVRIGLNRAAEDFGVFTGMSIRF